MLRFAPVRRILYKPFNSLLSDVWDVRTQVSSIPVSAGLMHRQVSRGEAHRREEHCTAYMYQCNTGRGKDEAATSFGHAGCPTIASSCFQKEEELCYEEVDKRDSLIPVASDRAKLSHSHLSRISLSPPPLSPTRNISYLPPPRYIAEYTALDVGPAIFLHLSLITTTTYHGFAKGRVTSFVTTPTSPPAVARRTLWPRNLRMSPPVLSLTTPWACRSLQLPVRSQTSVAHPAPVFRLRLATRATQLP